jgi:hypothetical protein
MLSFGVIFLDLCAENKKKAEPRLLHITVLAGVVQPFGIALAAVIRQRRCTRLLRVRLLAVS